MKRIIKVLVVTALMMVLMATSVSPAFASQPHSQWWGYGDKGNQTPKDERWNPHTEKGSWGKAYS